jgi:hypothetical protein
VQKHRIIATRLVNLSVVLKKLVCLRWTIDVGDRVISAQLMRKSWLVCERDDRRPLNRETRITSKNTWNMTNEVRVTLKTVTTCNKHAHFFEVLSNV